MSTIFSKIIRKEIPAKIVYEDDVCLAFHDISPKAPVHILIIPKKEIRSLGDVEPGDALILGHILVKAGEIAKAQGLEKSGWRLVTNTGDDGGQTVFHLHFHLLGGRALGWPPG